jgi:H+/Cl- antiporter ClcA
MSVLFNVSILLLITAVFSVTVFGYFFVSRFFQSEKRSGRLSGDGIALLIAGVLFAAFTASYIEIFDFAFRLPYSAYVDLGIGLASVAAAVAIAHTMFGFVKRRPALPAKVSKNEAH